MRRNVKWVVWGLGCVGCFAAAAALAGANRSVRADDSSGSARSACAVENSTPADDLDTFEIVPGDRIMCCMQGSTSAPACVRMQTAEACAAVGGISASSCARCRIAISAEESPVLDDGSTPETTTPGL